jgi:hypothetical protein
MRIFYILLLTGTISSVPLKSMENDDEAIELKNIKSEEPYEVSYYNQLRQRFEHAQTNAQEPFSINKFIQQEGAEFSKLYPLINLPENPASETMTHDFSTFLIQPSLLQAINKLPAALTLPRDQQTAMLLALVPQVNQHNLDKLGEFITFIGNLRQSQMILPFLAGKGSLETQLQRNHLSAIEQSLEGVKIWLAMTQEIKKLYGKVESQQ